VCISYAQIIALRFGDGSGFVSIPEFLEFFTTPSHVRLAKAATSAVRMSLGLLTMAQDEEYLHQDGYEEEEEGLGEDDDEEAELKAKVSHGVLFAVFSSIILQIFG